MATWVPTDPETVAVWEEFRWAVPNAHSAYLDVALQLGLVGLGLLLTIIAVVWHRARACCKRGILPLGWFSLLLIAGALLYGVSETGLGQNQSISWLLLNVFNFSCGLKLASLGRRGQWDRLALSRCRRAMEAYRAFLQPQADHLDRVLLKETDSRTTARIVIIEDATHATMGTVSFYRLIEC